MPRKPVEQPLSDMMTTVLRLRKHTEMSTKLPLKSKQTILKHLTSVLSELQIADVPVKEKQPNGRRL